MVGQLSLVHYKVNSFTLHIYHIHMTKLAHHF